MITILYVFGVIGLLDTLYLMYHKWKGTEVACPFFPKEWCHTVQHSRESKTFGIPNSVAGFFMYAAILVLTYFYAAGMIRFWPILALVTFGFLFSLYFMYVQKFVLRAFCTWCVLSFINFTVMFIAVWFF
ncbi:vitamin K epoxide reductase family protein [Candidatus Nomurabacteria bacterium]|nr:vitamin K epoxide reductase family protein [Candidatus Nomurabacteria bacterium]